MPTTTYGPTTTAAEIVANVDLRGKRAVVTGASSGIGVETARALASTGAEVTLAVRNVEAGRKVADEIAEKLPSGAAGPQVARLDLADPASVAGFVHSWSGPLHILVNNAGVMALPQLARTAAGPPALSLRTAVVTCVLPSLLYGTEVWYTGRTKPARHSRGLLDYTVSARVGWHVNTINKTLVLALRGVLLV